MSWSASGFPFSSFSRYGDFLLVCLTFAFTNGALRVSFYFVYTSKQVICFPSSFFTILIHALTICFFVDTIAVQKHQNMIDLTGTDTSPGRQYWSTPNPFLRLPQATNKVPSSNSILSRHLHSSSPTRIDELIPPGQQTSTSPYQ